MNRGGLQPRWQNPAHRISG